jgi:hypothetical protein
MVRQLGRLVPSDAGRAFRGLDKWVHLQTAIPGDAKSPGNRGLRRMGFRNVYAHPATRFSRTRRAFDPRFSGVFLNYLSVPFV